MAQQALGPAQSYGRLISEVFHPMELATPGAGQVRARFVSRGDDWLRATQGRVEHEQAISGRRSAAAIARGTRDEYLLVTTLSGTIAYSQFGRTALTAPGAMVLLDARTPYEFERRVGGAMMCHHLRGEVLRAAVDEPNALCGTAISGAAGLGGALRRLLDSAWGELVALAPAERHGLARAIAVLLAAAGGAEAHAARRGLPPYTRALDHIADHLDDPALDARGVAAAIGVSVSHLHAVMQRRGTTIGRTVQALRLDRCAEALKGPQGADWRVGDLAYRWGFADAAHFSRVFRARFGCAPRDYRGRA